MQNIISLLVNDAALQAIPAPNTLRIFTGPVDIIQQTQASLNYPVIILEQVSEVSRTVPINTRDTQIQLDIISRNSQFELEQLYEEVLNVLNYGFGSMSGGTHLYWERLSGAVDMNESDRRIWRRVLTFTCWSIKP